MARERIANPFYAGSNPVTYSSCFYTTLVDKVAGCGIIHTCSLKICRVIFAPFVYRLGRCPFKAERGVRFSYGVPVFGDREALVTSADCKSVAKALGVRGPPLPRVKNVGSSPSVV